MFIPVTEKERQNFLSKNERKFIPGYTGHCPHIKFHFGKSYGADTKEILEELHDHAAIRNVYSRPYREEDYSKEILKPVEKSRGQTRDPLLDYKYRAPKFILGYTGFIPTMTFRYGKTFGRAADDSISEFSEKQRQYRKKKEEEQKRVRARSAPRLNPIRSEDQVDRTIKEYEAKITYKEKELCPECPPISGYTGHIPRVRASEESLSQRYSTAVRRSLERLKEERKKKSYFKNIQDDIDCAIKDLNKQCLKDD